MLRDRSVILLQIRANFLAGVGVVVVDVGIEYVGILSGRCPPSPQASLSLQRTDSMGNRQEDVNPSATFPLSPNNLLLRGASLRNTDHVLGCVVYAGHDTKVRGGLDAALVSSVPAPT